VENLPPLLAVPPSCGPWVVSTGGSPFFGSGLPERSRGVLRLRKVPVDRPQRLESGLELVLHLVEISRRSRQSEFNFSSDRV